MAFSLKFDKNPHLEQFERVKRWHKVLNDFRYSNASKKETNWQIDCIYAFFTNCYHLQDWIVHSKKMSTTEMNQFIKKHPELMICRDICNASKHLSLTHPSIDNSAPECNCGNHGVFLHLELVPKGLHADKIGMNPIKDITYNISAKFKKFNVFTIADDCVAIWGALLKTFNDKN